MREIRTDEGRIRLRITGRVQGVGFRWFVREHARRLGLSGWVRNEPDGAVEVVAAGPTDLVGDLQAAVASGPPGARVENVQSLATDDEELPSPFAVRK